jgi:hypothetical protein
VHKVVREINFDVVQCVVLAGPGFTKDQFFEHLVKRATREDDKRLMAARSKFVLVPASSGHRGALREVMADPAVLARLADTKAARETMAIQKFAKMLDEDPDRAYYGCVRCSIATPWCGSRRRVASRRSITIFAFSSTLISIPSHCSLCQCNRLFIFSLVLISSFSCSSSSSSFYNFSFLIWPFFNFLLIVSFFVSSPAPHRYNHVLLANESQAIDTLMLTDSLFRSCDIPTRRRYVDLVEKATENGATVLIFSSLHVSGERLASLSGIAAILRFVRVRAHCPRNQPRRAQTPCGVEIEPSPPCHTYSNAAWVRIAL